MIPSYATQEAALTVYCFYVRENHPAIPQESLWKWFPSSQKESNLEITFCKLDKLLKKDSSFMNACGVG